MIHKLSFILEICNLQFIVDDLMSINVSSRATILISFISILDSSASNLEAAEISFINLSTLSTSF